MAGASAAVGEASKRGTSSDFFHQAEESGLLIIIFKQKTTPIEGWATYSPSRLGGSLAYAIVFGCAFTSDLQQKTTSVQRWATYPTDRSAGNLAYAIVFGCAFTSGIYISIYFFARGVKFFTSSCIAFEQRHSFSGNEQHKKSMTYIHQGRVQPCTINITTFNLR